MPAPPYKRFENMLANSQASLGKMKWVITAFMLTGLIVSAHAATETGKKRVEVLKEELQRLERAAVISRQNRADVAELEKKRLLVRHEQAEVDKLKSDLAAIQSEKEQLRQQYQAHIKAVRAKAASQEIAELRTKNGKVYSNVCITRFDPDGVSIRHQNGGASVHHTLLPDEMQERFKFDPEKAKEFAEEDAKARAKLRHTLAQRRKQKPQRPEEEEAPGQHLLPLHQDMPAVPNHGLPPAQQDQPKIVDGSISVRVVATRRVLQGYAKSTQKKIKVSARAGTEDLSVQVSSPGGGGSFTVRAREKGEKEYWVSSQYTVKAYQGGRLVDEESDRRKRGL